MRFGKRKAARAAEAAHKADGGTVLVLSDSSDDTLREPVVRPLVTVRRDEARWKIIQAANNFRYMQHNRRISTLYQAGIPNAGAGFQMPIPLLWGMRHINEAVQVVRHNGLVDDETLRLAGFNPFKRR